MFLFLVEVQFIESNVFICDFLILFIAFSVEVLVRIIILSAVEKFQIGKEEYV